MRKRPKQKLDPKTKVKQYLSEQGIDNEDMYCVCRFFLVERRQYPPRLPSSWGGIAPKIVDSFSEFKAFVEDGIDYELMNNLNMYGC